MSKLTIDRATWVNGRYDLDDLNNVGDTALLNEQGCRCCLGFYATAIGFTDEQIRCVASPDELDEEILPRDKYGGFDFGSLNKGDVEGLISRNDDVLVDDASREEAIAERFAARGVEVEFIGEYPQIGGGE